jgi:hypothetical protein
MTKKSFSLIANWEKTRERVCEIYFRRQSELNLFSVWARTYGNALYVL